MSNEGARLTEARLREQMDAMLNEQPSYSQPPIVTRRIKEALYWVRLNKMVEYVTAGEDYAAAFRRADHYAYSLAGGR